MLVTDTTFATCAERVERSDDLVVDLETDGLTPWKGSRAAGIAVEPGDGGDPMYFSFRHGGGGNLSAPLERFLPALAPRASRVFRGWHLRYDLTMLSYEDGGAAFLSDAVALDGIITALLVNENEPSYSLATIARKYLRAEAARTKRSMDELLAERFPEIRSPKQRKGQLWKLHGAEAEEYACGDVTLPRELAGAYAPAIFANGLGEIEREMNAYALQLARMQKRGILIDRARCEQLSVTTDQRKAGLLAMIRDRVGSAKFNPGSWQQVSALLGTPDAREATLRQLPAETPNRQLAQWIIDYKKLGKAKSAYYDAILELMDGDSVLHPQLNLTRDPRDVGGTRSSRLSCALPNFQALPHADDDPNAIYQVRDLVIPRPGFKLAKCDYERAEMWMAASFCKEVELIASYHARIDEYVGMARELGITRQQAKILFLMLQYGAGAWKVAQMLGWPFRTVQMLEQEFGVPAALWGDAQWRAYKDQRAVRVRDGFFERYPRIKDAMKSCAAHFENTGQLQLWTGRVLHYDPATTPSYAAWNRLIQGAVGEMIRLAMMRLEPMLAQYGAAIILQVHDELLIEYPAEAERPVLRLVRHVMEDFDFDLRPRVDILTSAENYAKAA